MSTKYTEYGETQDRIPCKICDGRFVPGGVRIELPDGVCLWCFSRGRIYHRYKMLWDGLEAMYEIHGGSDCECAGCHVYRLALPVMSATMQESESHAP